VVNYQRKAVYHDPAVVAAVWEEDDGFVSSSVAKAQAVVDHSVVVRRSTAAKMSSRERLAQLPEDPFEREFPESTSDEPAMELGIDDPPVDAVEEGIEQEFDRREGKEDLSDQELFGDSQEEDSLVDEEDSLVDADAQDLFEEVPNNEEPQATEVDPFEEPQASPVDEPGEEDALFDESEELMEQPSIEPPQVEVPKTERDLFDEAFGDQKPSESKDLSELLEEEMRKDESDGSTLPAAEEDDLGSEVESEGERAIELGEDPGVENPDEMSEERKEAERNCAEEIAKAHAERIDDIDLSITLEGDAGEDFPFECRLDAGQHELRQWPQITYNWKAAALCHKPLYFEQVHLERYGHSWGPYVQPIMSGVHFFGTVPLLPYKMGIRTPTECVYTLGYYRPGSCAPYLIDPVPFTWRAALFQGATATALPFIIP